MFLWHVGAATHSQHFSGHLPGTEQLVILCGLVIHPIWQQPTIICGEVLKTTYLQTMDMQRMI